MELTVSQAAQRIGCSRVAIWQAIQDRRLKARLYLGRWILHSDNVDKYAATMGLRNNYRKGGAGAKQKK